MAAIFNFATQHADITHLSGAAPQSLITSAVVQDSRPFWIARIVRARALQRGLGAVRSRRTNDRVLLSGPPLRRALVGVLGGGTEPDIAPFFILDVGPASAWPGQQRAREHASKLTANVMVIT